MASRVCPGRGCSQARWRLASRLGDGRSLGVDRPKSWSRFGCWAKSRKNERIDSTRQVKTFGHFLGGVLLQKVGPTNLVVALGGGRRLLEQGGKCGRTCHGSWGWRRQGGGCPRPSRQLSPDRGRERLTRRKGLEKPPPRTADRDAASQAKVKTRQGPAGKVPNGPLGRAEGKRGKAGESQERVTKSGGPARKLGGLRKSARNSRHPRPVNAYPLGKAAA